MKFFLLTLSLICTCLYSFGQETIIELKINGEAASGGELWKLGFLIFFAISIIALVLRTFRGKSDA